MMVSLRPLIILSYINWIVAVALEYGPLAKKHQSINFIPNASCLDLNLGNQQKPNHLCHRSFPLKTDAFKCQPSQFQCLASLESSNCCSMPAADCSQQHCPDGSDAAFCYLQESFWQLGQVPANVSSKLQTYLQLELMPMPLAIQQWLMAYNSSLVYSVLIYQTVGHHVTSLAQSTGPSAYPHLGAAVRLPGPVIDGASDVIDSVGYAVTIDLRVLSPAGVAVDVSPALTRRFAVALTPPRLLDAHIDSFVVFAMQPEAGLRSRVRVQMESNSHPGLRGSSRLSLLLSWRCSGSDEVNGSKEVSFPSRGGEGESHAGDAPRYLLDTIVTLGNVSNASACKFWTSTGSIVVGVSSAAPEFSVELDFLYGVNATADGGLDVAWRVPEAWSGAYPPVAYNFTIDYWPRLCGRGGASLSGLRETRAKLKASLLNPATRYWVSVRACDPRGCGPRSGYAIAQTVGPPIPPVDLVSADLINGTDLDVSWRVGPVAPEWPAGKSWLVSLYYDTNLLRVVCSDTLAADANVEQSVASRVRLDHLEGCSLYAMRVQVTDPAGFGWASPIYLQATGLSSTSPPKNVQYTYPYRGNSTQALVTWNAPCVIVFTPVAYILRVTDMFTEDTKETYIDATADSVVSQLVDELEAGTLYRLMVFTNSVGGKSSVPVVLQTDSFVGVKNLSAHLAPGPLGLHCQSGNSNNSVSEGPVGRGGSGGCRVAVGVRWSADLPLSLRLASGKLSKGVQIQFEIYGKLATSVSNSTDFQAAAAAANSVGSLWYRHAVSGPVSGAFDSVAFPCVLACPPAPLTYEIRTRVVLVSNDANLAVSGAFSHPTLLRLAAVSPPATPPACYSAPGDGTVDLARLVLAAAGSVALACLLLGFTIFVIRRRMQRRRWLRRSQLLLSEAYDDASGNLFPEHVSASASAMK